MMARMSRILALVFVRAFPDGHEEQTSLQIPTSDTRRMLVDSVQCYSVRTAMSPTLQTLESLSAQSLIHGSSKGHMVSPGHISLET